MSLFDKILGRSNHFQSANNIPEPTPLSSTSEMMDGNVGNTVPRNEFVADENPEPTVTTIAFGTGCPIDAIYAFITRDFEDEGYNDALVNNDKSYRDTKETLLRNNLKLRFQQVKVRYQDDIRKLKVQVQIAEESMVVSSAAQLRALIETFQSHLAEIARMEEDLERNDPKMTQMIESYKRGFLKGIAAQTYDVTHIIK